MKMVINALSARRGGGQTYLLELLSNLDGFRGESIHVLAPESLRFPADQRIVRVRVSWPTASPLLRGVWERLFLPRVLTEIGADLLFCPGGVLNTRTGTSCRTATMFRNMLPFHEAMRWRYPYGVRNWLLEKAILRTMRAADLVVFISGLGKEVIERRLGFHLNKSVVIPHGLDDRFKAEGKEAPPRPKWLPVGDYFLYVSIFDVYKHQLEVVQAFHLLRQQRETNEKLVLAGQMLSHCAKRIVAEIERLGLGDDVVLPGNVERGDLPGLYRNAKLGIFASECENCPNILLEALGAGRPLVVSKCPPMPEFAGNAAIYFDPLDPGDLAEKIASIVDNSARTRELSDKAVEKARGYDWGRTAHLTWQALESCCKTMG